MNTIGDTLTWFLDGKHWTGRAGVPFRLFEHVQLTVGAVLLACVVALPIALFLGHIGRGGALAVNISNVGRAVPTFAILVLFAASPIGFGNRATLIALVLFAIPPILTNAYVGVRGVDREVREAAVGIGMTGAELLRRVEVPLALPLISAGVRTAAVQVVATATLAALVGGGGLGRFIVDGFGQQDRPMLLAGAILVAALALVTELGLGAVQNAVTPGRRKIATLPGSEATPAPAGA